MHSTKFQTNLVALKNFRNVLFPVLPITFGCLIASLSTKMIQQLLAANSNRFFGTLQLLSPRCHITAVFVLLALVLIAYWSKSLFSVGSFIYGLSCVFCAVQLQAEYGSVSSIVIVWFFLPRLFLLSTYSVHVFSKKRSSFFGKVILFLFAVALLVLLQLLLYPVLIAPLL